jgi:adenosylhomocysteine nucleosidase
MTRVAIIAALAGELKPLVRGWEHESHSGLDLWRRRKGEAEWIAACAGAGVEAAQRAFDEIEKEGTIDLAFSIGWAGALREEFVAGQAYCVSGVIDARTGERFFVTDRVGERWLVTNPKVADQADKRRLAAAHGASLVDLEAAGIARRAKARGIPFHCIKGVSDGLADRLPDFNPFISTHGEFRLARFILFALFRPWYWPALMRVGKNSRAAAQNLREALLEILERSPLTGR